MFVAAAIAYLAAAAVPPTTTAPATPPTAADQAANPPKEKMVCTTDYVSGSLMPKRVCRTQAEAQAEAREMSRRSIELPSRGPARN